MKLHVAFFMSVAAAFVSVALSGCNKESVPEGFPALVPCQITVTKSGSPFEGVAVTLVPATGFSPLAITGKTNDQGQANLFTTQGSYMQSGVPQGDYKIVVRKDIPLENDSKSIEELKAMSAQERTAYEKAQKSAMEQHQKEVALLVPPVLSQPSSTPLTIQVSTEKSSSSIELTDYQK